MRSWLIKSVVFSILWHSPSAVAFTVEGPYRGGKNAIDHLIQSPRWVANPQSFLSAQERGLGKGLEYSFDDSLCSLTFDEPSVTCADIRNAVISVFSIWSDGHPAIQFRNVSDLVKPAFPLAALGLTDQGAEIDIFAASPEHFPLFRNKEVHGHTFYYTRKAGPFLSTNGDFIAPEGGQYQSADIRFNLANTYTLNPDSDCQNCVYFLSLALHEVGHVLGIGHPDALAEYNLDSDETPGNEIRINCHAPASGLKYSPNLDLSAVSMGFGVERPDRWLNGLSQDDLAARNALYPDCSEK